MPMAQAAANASATNRAYAFSLCREAKASGEEYEARGCGREEAAEAAFVPGAERLSATATAYNQNA